MGNRVRISPIRPEYQLGPDFVYSNTITNRVRIVVGSDKLDRIPKLIGLELLLNRLRQSNRALFKIIGPEYPETGKHPKTADIFRCHHWIPREMTSIKGTRRNFYTDDVSLPRRE